MSRCCADVWGGQKVYQCRRRGVILSGGQKYCYQHTPSAVRARRRNRAAKHKAAAAMRRRRKAEQEFCKLYTTEELESSDLGIIKVTP